MRQFGEPISGARHRPGAYAIIHDHDRGLAVVLTEVYVLPGGGVEASESFEEAAVREVAEETGLAVAVTGHVGSARQAIGRLNKEAHYFSCRILGEGRGTEPDHELRWFTLGEALPRFHLDADRWAVETWARASGRRSGS